MTPIRTLPHLFARLYGPPLLIPLARLEPLLSGFEAAMYQRGSVEAVPPAPTESLSAGDERPHGYRIERGVALLPVHGVLASRVGQIAPDSTPMQSYESIKQTLRSAYRDSRVRGVLLDVDSPGGEAGGVFDLARDIRAASQVKPIWAVANHQAISAAYLLAAATDRIWTTLSGALGSIGVIALHADQSERDAQEGMKYTYISRGDHKIDGHPHGPLSPEAHAMIQAEVDRNYEMLVTDLARYRHTDPYTLRATQARIYHGHAALHHALADHIGTVEQAHAALAEHIAPTRGRGTIMSDATPEARGFVDQSAVAAPDDNVIQMRVQAGITAERERAAAIHEVCKLHGVSDMAPELISQGFSLEQIYKPILERKSQNETKRALTAVNTAATVGHRTPNLGAELENAAQTRFAAQRRGLYSME